jgi:hypothetical protein
MLSRPGNPIVFLDIKIGLESGWYFNFYKISIMKKIMENIWEFLNFGCQAIFEDKISFSNYQIFSSNFFNCRLFFNYGNFN